MFSRFQLLVDDKLHDIQKKKVLIVGLGGVGSYAVEALIRSGISNITLIDNDIIDISNLNRQLMTNTTNIGLFKTDVLKERINLINPKCQVKLHKLFLDNTNIDDIITDDYDYVVDACDTINTKKAIIKKCHELNIKLISSMGTGNKMNPEKLKIMNIYKTSYDPIAKIIRKYCKDQKISKLMVVSSTEKPIKKVNKIIPSNAFVPACAGLLIGSYIINDIVGDLYV